MKYSTNFSGKHTQALLLITSQKYICKHTFFCNLNSHIVSEISQGGNFETTKARRIEDNVSDQIEIFIKTSLYQKC